MIFDLLKAIILGAVEGITEFLPISSTGHLIIVNEWLKFDKHFTQMFDIVIQLGAIVAVALYFNSRICPLSRYANKKEVFALWRKTLVAVLPALVIGFFLAKTIEAKFFNPITVAITLIIGGIALILLERRKVDHKINSVAELSYKTAFAIGLIQTLAMIPGTSRSAATIIGAMLLGASRVLAAEFSFFLAIPTIAAASIYSLLKNGLNMTGSEAVILLTGFVTSFLVALAVIKMFMKYIQTKNFVPFGYYRIVLGVLVLIYFLLK
ncbi:MAG: undecaprenyl-diphosphatase [Parcubacteria group bacterium Gr01-1014_13]|nr:MAG: undecaprenyl-diphosphatase [Parcubacteria group bacterium Gr01-1014_13]